MSEALGPRARRPSPARGVKAAVSCLGGGRRRDGGGGKRERARFRLSGLKRARLFCRPAAREVGGSRGRVRKTLASAARSCRCRSGGRAAPARGNLYLLPARERRVRRDAVLLDDLFDRGVVLGSYLRDGLAAVGPVGQ